MLGTSNDRVEAGMKIEVFPDDQEFLVHRSGLGTLYVWSTTPNLRDGDIQLEYQMLYPGDHIPESGSHNSPGAPYPPHRGYKKNLQREDQIHGQSKLRKSPTNQDPKMKLTLLSSATRMAKKILGERTENPPIPALWSSYEVEVPEDPRALMAEMKQAGDKGHASSVRRVHQTPETGAKSW